MSSESTSSSSPSTRGLPDIFTVTHSNQNSITTTLSPKRKSPQTSVPLVSSLALWTRLVPILSLVFITRTTHREGALVASNKHITSRSQSNSITAYLTDLPIQALQGFRLQIKRVSLSRNYSIS